MADILEYLQWRGDLTFAQSGFCEVDNLITAYFSYVDLEGVIPGTHGGAVTVEEAAERFFSLHSPKELAKDQSFLRRTPEVLKAAAATRRYRHALLRNYVNEIEEEKEQQFSAVEVALEDGTSYVAFKGTDDTIIGWKEDFNLSKGVVPAEEEACKYLEAVAGKTGRPLRVGGHSKGGHLAVYAAVNSSPSVQERILEIYSNDGPGFVEEFLEHPGLEKMQPKIRHIVPEGSIIGMLLKQVAEPMIVESSEKGVMQHDGFSWQILGPAFVHRQRLSSKAMIMDFSLLSLLEFFADPKNGDRLDIKPPALQVRVECYTKKLPFRVQ